MDYAARGNATLDTERPLRRDINVSPKWTERLLDTVGLALWLSGGAFTGLLILELFAGCAAPGGMCLYLPSSVAGLGLS